MSSQHGVVRDGDVGAAALSTEDAYVESQQTTSALRHRVVFAAQRDASETDAPLDVPTIAEREVWCRVLMFAVLEYWFERPATKKFRSAQNWIFYPSKEPNSFDNVAQFLGMSPDALRRAIVSRRAGLLEDPRRNGELGALLSGGGDTVRRVLNLDNGEG